MPAGHVLEQMALQWNFWPARFAVSDESSPFRMTVYLLTDWNATCGGLKPFGLVVLARDENADSTRVMLFPGDW